MSSFPEVMHSPSPSSQACELKLYVAGQTPRSMLAIYNLRKICETHMEFTYSVEIIDLLENPHLAEGDQIIAVPTLIRVLPEPIKRIIGDLSETEKVLIGLQIKPLSRSI